MSGQLAQQLSLPWISFVEVSPVRTYQAQARELALVVLAAASGLSTSESFLNYARNGLWSRMSPAALISGLTLSGKAWNSRDARAYRSRLRQQMLARRTNVDASSSLLPTLTKTANMLEPSMQKWPSHRNLLPTLTAQSYGSNQGGQAGRTGSIRESLQTMAKNGKLAATLCARDARGPTQARKSKGGRNLPLEAGGHLSPTFCEWFMGFPENWSLPASALPHSETP